MAIDKRIFNILIIEDNPGDFALVEDFLFEKFEMPVISRAENYEGARKILLDSHCSFDIILLDLTLPDKTGESLIKEVVEICKGTPVIVLTGYADFAFGVKSLSLGVSDYILKDELTSLSLYKSIRYSSERRKIITDLEESEKKYSELFNISPAPVWIVDLNTLKFLAVNKTAIKNYGYSREEFLSMRLPDLWPPDVSAKFDAIISGDKELVGQHSQREAVHKKKNGELMKVEVQISHIQFVGVLANLSIVTDITERLNYINAIERQNEKLREISWIQSHIVRAPLARIMGLIPLIKDLTEENEAEKKKMLEYMFLSANELDDIIRDISDKTIVDDDGTDRRPNQ